MTPEQLLTIANEVVYEFAGKRLSDVETAIMVGAIADQTYEQISEQSGYSISYVKRDAGPKFWKLLGDALGEPVSKTNFRAALERWQAQKTGETPTQAPGFSPSAQEPGGDRDSCALDTYVERPPIEATCYAIVQEPGALLRIKAPNLMGKSQLLNRLVTQTQQLGYRTVNLSLAMADQQIHFSNIDRFMRWFCFNLSRELGLPAQLDEYWNAAELGSKISCTTYLEDYLLPQISAPLVLCLDDVDLIFPHPEVYEDFFSLLRSWHEKAKSRPLWKQLRLVLAHATDVYILLKMNQSPFNVGVPIELAEFTPAQTRELAERCGLAIDAAGVNQLMDVIGGHPYLLQQTFAYLKHHPQATLSEILEAATTPASIYHHHLRERWLNLQTQPALLSAFKSVISSTEPVSLAPMSAYQLHRMGLIKFCGNQAVPCCRLYQQYFGEYREPSTTIDGLSFLEGMKN